jgi:hypothetical protein
MLLLAACDNGPIADDPEPFTMEADVVVDDAPVLENDGTNTPLESDEFVRLELQIAHDSEVIRTVTYAVTGVVSSGETFLLPQPIYVTIDVTPRFVAYDLSPVHTVPFQPYEDVIKVDNTVTGVCACVDSASSDTPTMGWTLDESGQRIPDSQGFCLNKSIEVLNDPQGAWRGEIYLGETSTLINSFSTGHAMRLGAVMCDGYEVVGTEPGLSVTVQLFTSETPGTVAVGPEQTGQTHSAGVDGGDYEFSVTLANDFSSYGTLAPLFGGYVFYVPVEPPSDDLVQNAADNLMMVPDAEVTRDGSEADKVGVGFSTFRDQMMYPDTSVVGDGLHNQLCHKHAADLALIDVMEQPHYLVTQMDLYADSLVVDTQDELSLHYDEGPLADSSLVIDITVSGVE